MQIPEGDTVSHGDNDPSSTTTKYSAINWPVFGWAAALIIAFVLWAWLAPGQAEAVIFGSMDWIATNLGWYYILTAGIIVAFVLIIALSRVGRTRLGPDHSRPKYRMFTWASMLFAAGIGVDLMFFSISGPATNLLTPPEGAPMSDEAARMAPLWTIFHYGIPGWAMYALMGVALGLFAYRYHFPLSIRSALAPIFGKRIKGAAGHTVEVAATIGTIFGIGVSLGIGVVFLNFGLSALFGWPNSRSIQIALIVLSVIVAVISTVSGVDKGIRRLSELNVVLAVGLMLWILITGKTAELLGALVQNIGDFISRFPGMMLNNFAYTDGAAAYPADQWLADWTLFFWAWWIAWAPFVGLFLARISRGRTLREFIFGVLLIPPGFILIFVSIFSNSAIGYFRSGEEEFLNEAVNVPESGFFNLLTQYPGSTFLIAVAIIVGLLFYITSADSGSLVMANMTSKASRGDSDGAPWLRIFWAVVTGALTLVMLFIDGVYTLQAATVLIGLPFSVVMYMLMYSVWKVLRSETYAMDSRALALPGAVAGRTLDPTRRTPWQRRLTQRMSFPDAKHTTEFIADTGAPAVEEVGVELKRLGLNVSCERGEHPEHRIPFVDLVVEFPEQEDFKYQLYPVAYTVPNYASGIANVNDIYYRVEVFTMRGTRRKNTMGWTRDQIIADVLDSYDAHVTFMSLTGNTGAAYGELPSRAPSQWGDEVPLESTTTASKARSDNDNDNTGGN